MTSRAFFTVTLLILPALSAGCGGGGNPVNNNPSKLVIGGITGPDTITELASASYSISARGDTRIVFSWKVDPVESGSFDNPEFSTTEFKASEVSADTEALLSVTVGSDNCEPQTAYKGITIKNKAVDTTPHDIVPPIAAAKAEPLAQKPGYDIYFTDNGSYDPGEGDIVKWEWDWNNDGVFDQEGIGAHHSWLFLGSYLVQFRVTDDDGSTDTLDIPLSVNIGFGWGYTWGGVENDESTDALITDDRLYLLTNYDSVSINAPGGSNLTAPGSNVSRISRDGSWIGLFPVSQDPQAHESSVSLAVASNGLICVAGDRGLDAFLRAFNQDGSLVKERIDEGYSYGGSGGGSSNSYVPIVAAADESSIFLAEKHGWSWWREIPCGNKPMFEGGCGIDLEVYQCDNDFNKLHSLCYGDAGYLSDMVLGDDGTFYMIGSGSYYEGTVLDYGTDLDHLAERVILDRYEGVSTKMALENDGTIFITGHSTYSFDSKNSAGKNDCFLTKINPDKSIAWIVTWGGPDDDFGLDVATDRNGNAYVIGTFRGAADFDTSDAVYEVTAEGIQDAFVLKVDPDGVSKWVRTFGGSPDDEVTPAGIVTDSIGCLYLYGSFTGSIDIDPTHGEDVRLSVGKKDLFLIKMLPGGNW